MQGDTRGDPLEISSFSYHFLAQPSQECCNFQGRAHLPSLEVKIGRFSPCCALEEMAPPDPGRPGPGAAGKKREKKFWSCKKEEAFSLPPPLHFPPYIVNKSMGKEGGEPQKGIHSGSGVCVDNTQQHRVFPRLFGIPNVMGLIKNIA